MSGEDNEMEPELQPPLAPPPVAPQPPEQQQPMQLFVAQPIHLPPPSPPPPPHIQRSLYIRGNLDMAIVETLGITTICPTSMEWLLYLKAVQVVFPTFQFETIRNDNEVPRFESGSIVYKSLEDFTTKSNYSLEPKEELQETHLAVTDALRELVMAKRKNHGIMLIQVRKKKMRLVAPLADLTAAYVYGCRYLCRPDTAWISDSMALIKAKQGIQEDEELGTHLEAKMEAACATLSKELGNRSYFLHNLMDETAIPKGRASLSIVDAQYAAAAILIMKCFDSKHGPHLPPYNSRIRSILKKYIALWAQADRMYSLFVREKTTVHQYQQSELNEQMLTPILGNKPQASGGFANVYKVYLATNNDWKLQEGYYAFKVASKAENSVHIERETLNLEVLPYQNVATLVGYGKTTKEVHFLITKWIPGGDLETRIEGLSWKQVKSILKAVAYALHLVHKTANTCILDLKPENILLNETDDPILCDIGLGATTGTFIGLDYGTSTYKDLTMYATPQRDIFSYGVTLFQIMTNEVSHYESGSNFCEKLLPRLQQLEKEENLEELIKVGLRDEGCRGDIAKAIIGLGVRCIGEKDDRPSALGIYSELERLGFRSLLSK